MKWSELSLKERKQIYDSVRADNPSATYFNIKQQFDTIPTYEDGGKAKPKITNNFPIELGLTPGTPQYLRRQQQISGRADVVQPEAYLSPTGYIKDAITTVEDLVSGDYSGAAVSALMNIIPFGVGKLTKKLKAKVSSATDASAKETNLYSRKVKDPNTPSSNYMSSFTPKVTITKGKAKMSDVDAAEVARQTMNKQKHSKNLQEVLWDAWNPTDWYTTDRVKRIDKAFNTDYHGAYMKMMSKDLRSTNKLIEWTPKGNGTMNNINFVENLPYNSRGKVSLTPEGYKKLKENPKYIPNVDDFIMQIDPNQYYDNTINHELGHIADGLNNGWGSNATNGYLNYLLDEENIIPFSKLQRDGFRIDPGIYDYLRIPTEAKSHMLGLRRSLYKQGKIGHMLEPITEEKLAKDIYQIGDPTLINQYQMYNRKDKFVQRLNNLTPLQVVPPMFLPIAEEAFNFNNSNE